MSNTKVKVVNLGSLSKPKVEKKGSDKWVSFGSDNNYYQELIDRAEGSPTNRAIVEGVGDLIYGRGLEARDANRNVDGYTEMKRLFKPRHLRRAAKDLKKLGQCAFQLIYNKDKSKIVEVHHLPAETLRMSPKGDSGEVESFWYSKDWTQVRKAEYKPVEYKAFGHGGRGDKLEIMYIQPYRSGQEYYSTVDYQGGLMYARMEEEISNYHLTNIQSGFSPTTMITFPEQMTEEEQNAVVRGVESKFQGTSGKRTIFSFVSDKETAPIVEVLPITDAAETYTFLSNEAEHKIIVSHRVTSPMLLGIKNNTGLGNNADEIKTASLHFQNTVIRGYQDLIIDSLDEILAFNGTSANMFFKTLQPLEFTDEAIAEAEQVEEVAEEQAVEKEEREVSQEEPKEELNEEKVSLSTLERMLTIFKKESK